MNRSMTYVFALLLVMALFIPAYSAQTAELDEIQRLEDRLTALEQEAAVLRSDIELLKSQTDMNFSYEEEPNLNMVVPGTWACTNNVFNYEISLMQHGGVTTKEMSSGKTMQGKWLRRGKDDMVIFHSGYRSSSQGKNFKVKAISEDRMSLEEPNSQSLYDCNKLSQE